MKRKHLFSLGFLCSVVIFFMFYSYFWYTIGYYKEPTGIESAIFFLIYLMILVMITFQCSKSLYQDRKQALSCFMLFFLPLFIFFMLVLFTEGIGRHDVFAYTFAGFFGLNTLIYGLSYVIEA